MNPIKELDYVRHYAELMREDSRYFKQQKMLIDSQIRASRELFLKKFGEKNFKENARKYLRETGLLQEK